MYIHTNEFGETLLTHKGKEPIKTPITAITDTAELSTMVGGYFDELPITFKATILVPGVAQADHPCSTLWYACNTAVNAIKRIKKAPVADDLVLVVMYDRYKQALTMIIGRLRYQISPDTLISKQVGNA